MSIDISILDSYFQNIIRSLMTVERQPLERLAQKRDAITLTRSVFVDLKTQLYDLQLATRALTTTDAFSALTPGRSVAVTPTTTGTTVATAAAASSAAAGDYDLSVTQLALAQRRASAAQGSADTALGKTGSFWLGGTGEADASVTPNATLTAVGTAALASGARELATGTYTLQTRDNQGQLQFRLRDSDGNGVAIANAETGDVTTAWQDLTGGVVDTGRGLTLTLSGLASHASTSLNYTAAGVSVESVASDSLMAVASRINAAAQPVGREIQAAVVGDQLVLSAAHTGVSHTMIYRDDTNGGGLGFLAWDTDPETNNLQDPRDAEFTVNGLSFTRSSNNGLTNVVSSLTLSLAMDAEGHTARITVSQDHSAARTAIQTFIERFNSTQAYLNAKTAVAASSDESVSYSRGPLADDPSLNWLGGDLFGLLLTEAEGAGTLRRLQDLGLGVGDDLQLKVTNSEKLEAALTDHLDEAGTLLDTLMSRLDTALDRYTDSEEGMVVQSVASFDQQIREAKLEANAMTERLTVREEFLVLQFADMKSTLINLAYMQEQWASIYNIRL